MTQVRRPAIGEASPGTSFSRDLAVIAWLARHHRCPFTETAVRTSLPAGAEVSSPEGMARALGLIGLKARSITLSPDKVDAAVLPCVLTRADGTQAVLTHVSPNRRSFILVDPAADALELELKRRALRREFSNQVLLVARHDEDNARNGEPASSGGPRSWFWKPVRECWLAWVQILVAALCLNLLTFALPIFVMNVYDRVIPNAAFVTLVTLASGVLIAMALDLALRSLRAGILERIGRRVDLKVATALFEQCMSARLLSRPGGAAGMANTIRDFESVRDFFGSASFVAVIDLLFIGLFVAGLFFVVGPLAWVPLLAIPVVVLLAIVAQVPLRRSAVRAQQLATRRHIVLVESLLGIEAIKSLNGEPVMQREWENAISAASRIGGQTRLWSGLATNGTLLVQQGVSVAIIVWGVFLVSDGTISVGALVAASMLSGRVLAPLSAIAQTIFRAHYAASAMRSLTDLMAMPRERPSGIRSSLRVDSGAIEFRDVSLRYPSAQHPALDRVSFQIAPGEVVALLGRVGSGKTTTGKLMNGLLTADTGTILLDGHALAQFDPAELRNAVGYLTQESELFTGTLRENMTIGRPSASDEEIRRALTIAGMDEFVAAHPTGLDMFLGDKGQRLSGGQRQGVALARLLIRQPRILFLDEPTNAMDQQMEAAVIARIRELSAGDVTVVLCTHRMSLANLAERFIVLDRGRKVLDGPKQEVLATLRTVQLRQAEG